MIKDGQKNSQKVEPNYFLTNSFQYLHHMSACNIHRQDPGQRASYDLPYTQGHEEGVHPWIKMVSGMTLIEDIWTSDAHKKAIQIVRQKRFLSALGSDSVLSQHIQMINPDLWEKPLLPFLQSHCSLVVTVDSHGGGLITVMEPCPGGLDTQDPVRDTEWQDRWMSRHWFVTSSPWNRDEYYTLWCIIMVCLAPVIMACLTHGS